MTTPYTLIAALGVHVAEVPDLPAEVALVEDQRVGLIRKGLDPHARSRALDWLTQQAARLASSNE